PAPMITTIKQARKEKTMVFIGGLSRPSVRCRSPGLVMPLRDRHCTLLIVILSSLPGETLSSGYYFLRRLSTSCKKKPTHDRNTRGHVQSNRPARVAFFQFG